MARATRSWSDELARCEQATGDVRISVHFEGTATMWVDAIRIPASLCAEISRR